MNDQRIKFNKENNTATLSFNPVFYNRKAIELSISDFSECCRTQILPNTKRIDVLISEPHEDACMQEIVGEFCNYVLAKMKQFRGNDNKLL